MYNTEWTSQFLFKGQSLAEIVLGGFQIVSGILLNERNKGIKNFVSVQFYTSKHTNYGSLMIRNLTFNLWQVLNNTLNDNNEI